MNNKLSNRQNGTGMSISKVSKIVGALFILSLIVPILNWAYVLSKFVSVENTTSITQNILTNETFFRLNIVNEILTAIIIITLAIFLYVLLKSENKRISLLGFSFRFIEAILTLLIATLHLIILIIVKDENILVFNQNGLDQFTQLIINKHVQLTFISGIFFGLGMLFYSFLLFKSKLISKELGIFGIVSYTLIFLYDSINVLFPEISEIVIVQIVCTIPMCLFHVIIGIALFLKGFRMNKKQY